MNAEIQAWLESSREYAQGVELIAKYGSEGMARSYRRASPRFMIGQVVAILQKLAARTVAKEFSAVPGSAQPSQPDTSHAPGMGTADGKNEKAQVPESIKKAKVRLTEFWQKLNTLHQEMLSLGDANDEETKAKRVKLMKERKPYIEAFSRLYDLKEEYFALPAGERQVPPELEELLEKLDGRAVSKTKEAKKADLKKMDELSLYRLRKSTLEKIRRRNYLLKFQEDTPGTPDPMPEGPRRKTIESEIAGLQELLRRIDKVLKKG